MTNKTTILRDFVRELGKQTKPCNCYDANVCDFSVDRQSWKPVIQSGRPFSEEFRGKYAGHQIHLMANLEVLLCELKAGFDVGVCSINQPNRVHPVSDANLRVGSDRSLPVFAPRMGGPEADAMRLFLLRRDVSEIIGQLIADDFDSLHFFEGGVHLYCRPKSAEQVRSTLLCLLSLARLFAPARDDWNLESLPLTLRGLVGLIQKWAIADDSERAALQEEASSAELTQVVMAVDTHLAEIARYRDFAGDSDEAAMALGTLEECAAEIRLLLNRK